MFLIGEVSRTQQIVFFFFLRKLWSKACREKSADAIVVGKKKVNTTHEGQNLIIKRK